MSNTKQLLTALLAALTDEAKPTMGQKGRSSGKRRNPAYKAKSRPTSADNDVLAVAAFTAKGITGLTTENVRSLVKTYGKVDGDKRTGWLAEGRQVIPGQKGTKVGPFTLFHISQTQPIGTIVPKAAEPKAVAQPVAQSLSDEEIVEKAKAILAQRLAAKQQAEALQAEYGPAIA